jgi:pre-mRNA-splicing factor 38A
MANVTDPMVASLSGSDPQNLMEYITRQKIYDSRYWKEECFGLTLSDVLERAAETTECIGSLPTKFLSLTLKLLQLHPETELVDTAFVQQDEFKYVRALGCLYIRLTARPIDIYETLEALYVDKCKLRVWSGHEQLWSIMHFDEWIHQLLTESRVVGITLPRLPARRVLQDAGYLAEGPRPTALKDVLTEHGGVLEYLEYKVKVEKSPAAIALWEKRGGKTIPTTTPKQKSERTNKEQDNDDGDDQDVEDGQVEAPDTARDSIDRDADTRTTDRNEPSRSEEKDKERRPKKKQRNYDNLFKSKDKKSKKSKAETEAAPSSGQTRHAEGSDEYWNEQRAKLGMKPLQK